MVMDLMMTAKEINWFIIAAFNDCCTTSRDEKLMHAHLNWVDLIKTPGISVHSRAQHS